MQTRHDSTGKEEMGCRTFFSSPKAKLIHGPGPHPWDRIIAESSNFQAIPSLGALIEGWVLVVPKHPLMCFGEIPTPLWPELKDFVNAVGRRLRTKYGPVALFEHGAMKQDTAVGCGVDQAHLHLVPTQIPLLGGARDFAPQIVWHAEKDLNATRACQREGHAYLYLEQPLGSFPWVGTSRVIPSQLFRRVIARYLGEPEKYDWKSHPNLDNINATLAALTT